MYHRYGAEKRPDDFWAWDVVNDISSGPDAERAWELVLAVVRSAPDHRLEFVGAGPVENLVTVHAAALIDRIMSEAERDPRFREALAAMWLVIEDIPPSALEQLQRVTGNRILVATEAEIEEAGAEAERNWLGGDA